MLFAIMLIVANLMDKEGPVSQIAAKDATELRDNMEQASDMDGFTSDAKIGPQEDEEQRDEERQQAEDRAGKDQPEIAEFAWGDDSTSANGSEPATRSAHVERPAHHRIAPGEVRNDFNPTIRMN